MSQSLAISSFQGNQEGEQYPVATRLQPLSKVNAEEKQRMIAPDNWDAHEKNAFSEQDSCIFPYIGKY